LEQLWKYPCYAQMPLVGSFYWTMVHGMSAEDVGKDEEGMDICYQLGLNMAWLLKSIEAGQAAGLKPTASPQHRKTNFIR
jgi:multimeric flavodoxin WrbA